MPRGFWNLSRGVLVSWARIGPLSKNRFYSSGVKSRSWSVLCQKLPVGEIFLTLRTATVAHRGGLRAQLGSPGCRGAF